MVDMLAHMTITSPQQRKAVSEGFALGLIMSGTQQLPWNKVAIDIAFPEAWHDWQHKGAFPQVSTDLRNGSDPFWVITHADQSKHTLNLYWDTSGTELVIRRRSQWAAEPIDAEWAAQRIGGRFSPDAWGDLAARFLERFGP
ncbi:hypothetical protein [Microbacterium sp.]|uniref:hypothetical protein n=1 Tax=Microbacterium sp. TaxID=51671 RepID=UPI003F94C5B3